MVADPYELPMFPLGRVLFPHGALSLHVFEDRYRALVDHCLDEANEPEFGVVLITRGSEVGGGDVRADVGTVARIVEAGRFPDGRWALACAGTRRIRVARWLEDDPFPRAEVADIEELHLDDADGTVLLLDAVASVRRAAALAAELGEGSGEAVVAELADDPLAAAHQLAVLAPLGPLDALRVLSTPAPADRLRLLRDLCVEAAELLEFRLSAPDP